MSNKGAANLFKLVLSDISSLAKMCPIGENIELHYEKGLYSVSIVVDYRNKDILSLRVDGIQFRTILEMYEFRGVKASLIDECIDKCDSLILYLVSRMVNSK